MLSPDTVRQLASALETASAPYDIARGAALLLEQSEQASFASAHYLRALNMLRLHTAADRFVQNPMRSAGGGAIPWASRARRFAANLQALEARSPRGAALVRDAAAGLTGFELHQAADGNFQVLDLSKPLHAGWLGGLADHRGMTGAWQFDRAKTPVPHPVYFDGVSFGWALARVLDTTQNSFLTYSCAAYIFEPDLLALAMLLHMHDLQQILGLPRTRWFLAATPEEAVTEFRSGMEANVSWSMPTQCVRCMLRERPALPLEPVLQELQAGRDRRRQALAAEAESHYAGMTRAAWRARYAEALAPGSAAPLRVLGITSRYTTVLQHSMAELKTAAEAGGAGGADFQIAIEPDDHSLENPFLEKIASFKPDLIVQISRMRYENPNLPKNVPFLTWDQDNLVCMRTAQATASLAEEPGGRMTFVAGHGALQGYVYLDWPARSVILCHLAAATHRYRPRAATAEESARYGCDFSYISNASQSPQALRDQHLPRFGGGATQIFAALTDRVLASALDPGGYPWHEGSLREAVRSLCSDARVTLPKETFQEMLLSGMLVADRAFRHQTLQWVSDYCRGAGKSLKIYGTGWEGHPTLATHASGQARPGAELQAITLASRINLQIIGTGVLHARLLDGLSAGGFFMYRQTLNEKGDAAFLTALETVSRYVAGHEIETLAALDAATEPAVQAAWKAIGDTYRAQFRTTGIREKSLLRGIASAHAVRHPTLLLPGLAEIGFDSAESLAQKASRFLEDPAARESVAASLRTSVEEHFSYDARWRTFVGKIAAAMSAE